eukprot:8900415-Pyramimonas_sp.AAC.1
MPTSAMFPRFLMVVVRSYLQWPPFEVQTMPHDGAQASQHNSCMPHSPREGVSGRRAKPLRIYV